MSILAYCSGDVMKVKNVKDKMALFEIILRINRLKNVEIADFKSKVYCMQNSREICVKDYGW